MKHIIDTDGLIKIASSATSSFGDYLEVKKQIKALIANSPQADDVVKDAERWRYFRETATEEICYALCGNSNADNDELDQAIDQARKTHNN